MQRPLIIALDFSSLEETKQFLGKMSQEQLFVKVGMELFYQVGPEIISFLKSQGHSIFLDLKLHDIPNTVKAAMTGLAKLGVDIVNVHAAGGTAMMEAAIEGLEIGTIEGKVRPKCIAVTQLTSTSEEMMRKQLLIDKPLNDVVLHYATQAQNSGLDGVVCSSLEVPIIRAALVNEFITVTPGIRLVSDEIGDQNRVVTPQHARELGSTAIVVGRSITTSDNPEQAYQIIKQSWEGVSV